MYATEKKQFEEKLEALMAAESDPHDRKKTVRYPFLSSTFRFCPHFVTRL